MGNLIKWLYLRIRGPKFRIGQTVPYYGSITSISDMKLLMSPYVGYYYTLAPYPGIHFSETLIAHYTAYQS